MAAGHRTKSVRRNRKRRGKPSAFSGLRIVLSAAAVTVVLLLFAFAAIGMLLLARAPQEPLAAKLDGNRPLVSNSEPPPAFEPAPEPVVAPADPLLIPAPEPVPFATQDELEREEASLPPLTQAAEQEAETEVVAEPEPETTATIPNPPAQAEPKAVQVPAQKTVRRQPPKRHYVVRRAQPKQKESQTNNPLMQLFGIRQYR